MEIKTKIFFAVFVFLTSNLGYTFSKSINTTVQSGEKPTTLQDLSVQISGTRYKRSDERNILGNKDETWRVYPDLSGFELYSNSSWNHWAWYHFPPSREEVGTSFKLYTLNNPKEGISIDTTSPKTLEAISPELPLKFIIHGWGSSGMEEWVLDMVDAHLNYEPCRVIVVDWALGASTSVFDYVGHASGSTRVVGLEIAHLVKQLVEHYHANASNFHIIGHSLGAQAAGFAGERIPNLGRITGLDPAGPNFNKRPNHMRLDASDATFVDCIHTNAWEYLKDTSFLGMIEPVGHVDFYPNGGDFQPGCSKLDPSCNHKRAILLYIDSLRNSKKQPIAGYECLDMKTLDEGKCNIGPDNTVILGPLAIKNPTRGNLNMKLYFKTDSKSPYGLHHYNVKLNLVYPKGASNYVHGKLTMKITGDNGSFSSIWPESSSDLTEDYFYHEKLEKQFILLNSINVGKIRTIKLKWEYIQNWWKTHTLCYLPCDSGLYVLNVTTHLMGEKYPTFIGCSADRSPGFTRLESGSDFTYDEVCSPLWG